MKHIAIWMIALIMAGGGTAAEEPGMEPDASIVGVWRMAEFVNWRPDGTRDDRFGENPPGIFVYSPGGHLSLHVVQSPPPENFTAETTDAERGQATRGYIGYFGTYDVDYEAGIVTHKVEGALVPNRIGVAAERPFRLNGDTLEIEFQSDTGWRYYRRLVRVEQLAGNQP